jgi:hypothetical protein
MCITTSGAAGPRGYKGQQDLIVVVPAVGTPLMAAVGRTPRSPAARTHPQKVSTCTHHVDAGPADVPLRCCVMGGGTPIYDQVRGERLNADVPPSGTDPPRADYHGKHRLSPDTPVPAGVLGPPGPGDGFVQNHHRRVWTYPAGLPVPDGQPAATAWGPRAALPPEAHTRQAPRHAASSPPASATDRNPAARGTTAGDRGVRPTEAKRDT